MTEPWLLLTSPVGTPAYNMALDETLLRFAVARARPLLRLYRWRQPCVTFGYFQKFPQTLSAQFPAPQTIIRRPTGGGIVYHGDNVDTTYTVVVPPGHALHALPTQDAYNLIHGAVAAALHFKSQISNLKSSLRGGYECFQNPVAGDVVADDGVKLAGGAQRRGKNGMLHQGSIAAVISAERLLQGFRDRLAAEFTDYTLTPDESAHADKLTAEKYATEPWNHRVA
jgi:lipoate-protein ligase A